MSSLPVFFADPVPPAGDALLDGPEGHHAARVRRLRAGEGLILTDGEGRHAAAVVTAVLRDAVRLQVNQTQIAPQPSPRLIAVQALAKGDRGERAVELLTELGVDEIVPWSAQHCITKWDAAAGDKHTSGSREGEKARKARERWSGVAVQAAKQSRRLYFPTIAPLADTVGVTRRFSDSAAAMVLHESAQHHLADYSFPQRGNIVVVIGPEGGITPDELATFSAAGATAVRLGDGVLRTSTAGAAALAAICAQTRWRGRAA